MGISEKELREWIVSDVKKKKKKKTSTNELTERCYILFGILPFGKARSAFIDSIPTGSHNTFCFVFCL